VLNKTILKKTTGNVTFTSLAAGEGMKGRTSPFDYFIQIVDGTAGITIDDKKFNLVAGEGIIIPAHSKHSFNANEQFKMVSTVIKAGYED
jgi:quercetin dioxygenase-like cupin family protein